MLGAFLESMLERRGHSLAIGLLASALCWSFFVSGLGAVQTMRSTWTVELWARDVLTAAVGVAHFFALVLVYIGVAARKEPE